MNTQPIIIQGTATQYGGKYPEYYTDGKDIYKVIDSTCTANARQLVCDHKGIEYNGTFLNIFKELKPEYKKHANIIKKLGYEL